MIAANGPLAVQAVLRTIRDSEGKHEDDCWKDDAKVGAAVFASERRQGGPARRSRRSGPRSSPGR